MAQMNQGVSSWQSSWTTHYVTTTLCHSQPTSPSSSVVPETTSLTTSTTDTSGSFAPLSTSPSGAYTGLCSQGSPCDGYITYYDVATSTSNPSSCGGTNDGSTELVVALPMSMMTDSECGKAVTITHNGISWTGHVVDKCVGCDVSHLDISRAFFEKFAPLSVGNFPGITWYIH